MPPSWLGPNRYALNALPAMPTDAEPLIDAAHAAFMQGAVGVSIATCSQNNMPNVVRAVGCRVSPDFRLVTILVSAKQAGAVMADIRRNGKIAVVCSQPSTHRTIQIKGQDAVIGMASGADLQAVTTYRTAFARELEPFGYEEANIRAMLACPDADIVALQFHPCAAFSQTPGPNAGQPLQMGHA